MVRPYSKRDDWFLTDRETGRPLWGVPGVKLDGANLVFHRTHLPLLDHPNVAKYLIRDRAQPTSALWAERDAWCADHGYTLRIVQQQGLDFARPRPSVLLADEMRLGKTLLALMMHQQWSGTPTVERPLVIVAPLSTRAVWLGWIKRVFPGVEVGVIVGRTFKPEILRKPIVFGHYDVIHCWQAMFDIETGIFDEIQALTKPTPRRSLASTLLASKAKHVVACTGTPINKFPPDLWNNLGMVAPGAWGTYHEFARRYGAPESTGYGTRYTGVSNEAELNLRLSEVMLRRLWRDCHKDLPAITRSVVVTDLSEAERNKLDIIAGRIKADRSNTAANLAAYRRQVTTIKLPTVIREASRVLNGGAPILIWTWHKDFAELIAKRLGETYPTFVIHGDVPVGERDQRIAAWRDQPAAALVANMAVAGAGIDLSHTWIEIFAELDYTPTIIGQAEMRPFSPNHPLDVIFVVANHIVDQRITRSLVAKLGAADPLGVGAAIDSIDVLRDALMGPSEVGDLDRLLEDILASL